MKKTLVVILGVVVCVLALVLTGGMVPTVVHACGDETDPENPGGLKVQGYSVINDPDLLAVLGMETECSCAEALTILMENGFQIANVTGIQGPPGVVYTMARGLPGFSSGLTRSMPTPGIAIIKCGKAGSCTGSTGGCEDGSTGSDGCTH
ncbi:MAG: hypothetical protein JSV26_10595 [bacterium]|nr:MAG: hypothetical protein JSV26_10595 [bacterium]